MPSNHTSNDIDLVRPTRYNIQPNRVAETPPPELWPLPDFTILMTMVHLSIGRPKDKKDDDSVSLQWALEPHYIHKVDGKD